MSSEGLYRRYLVSAWLDSIHKATPCSCSARSSSVASCPGLGHCGYGRACRYQPRWSFVPIVNSSGSVYVGFSGWIYGPTSISSSIPSPNMTLLNVRLWGSIATGSAVSASSIAPSDRSFSCRSFKLGCDKSVSFPVHLVNRVLSHIAAASHCHLASLR